MVDESSGLHESVRRRLFLHLAYQQAPDAVTGAFRLWLAAEIQKDRHPDSLDWLEPILLERLAPDPELEALVNSGKWSFYKSHSGKRVTTLETCCWTFEASKHSCFNYDGIRSASGARGRNRCH
jgi:hypothetical protein